MTYGYAFGDHSLFLRKRVRTHTSLEKAFKALPYSSIGSGSFVHVYSEGALVAVIEFTSVLAHITSTNKPWKKRTPFDFWGFLERYINWVTYCRLRAP